MTFCYDSLPILEDVTFSLGSEEVLAVIGPNGAGKSTLLKCIDGLLRYRQGRIDLNGKAINKMHRKQIARHVAYVAQTVSNVFPFKVFDVVLQGRYHHGNYRRRKTDLEKAYNALRRMGVDDLAMRDFGAISGGQRQKVTIARALAQESGILLLDEPTSNLDILHQLEVMEIIRRLVKKNSISVIISIHDLNLASRYADKIIMLKQGKITAAGNPFSVLTPENIASVYHVDVIVEEVLDRPHIVPLKPILNKAKKGAYVI